MVDQIVRAELEHSLGDPTWLPDAKPKAMTGQLLSCCGATDLFANHDGHWTLTKRHGVVCA